MKSKKAVLLTAFSALILLCAALLLIESQTHLLLRAYDNYVMDNENHYLPCSQLPSPEEVERVVNEHQDILQQIEQVNPGLVGVNIDATTCPGHADLLIWYASHADRQAIKAIIGAETFFGIPYRLQNR
ncbi:MAG: hypothetical protein FD146_1031 [Anaerolineaceae bacterium]|nr:MAG: hypothetical protein FD146_1031 [Anaerolineaceae bacterium]